MITSAYRSAGFVLSAVLVASVMLSVQAEAAEPSLRSFGSPAEAAQSLIAAIKGSDEALLTEILGPSLKDWINSGDEVADRSARSTFVGSYEQRNTIETPSPEKAIIVAGNDGFPFPIPVVKSSDGGWVFDPQAGKQELIDRRVGRNERATIQTLLAIGDAQMEFAAISSEKSGAAEYSQRFISTEGKQDGLYWPSSGSAARSPLGELVARGASAGYRVGDRPAGAPSRPFNGYQFRMLFGQGGSAKGGAYSYLVKGRMIGGFAVIAWPVKYGSSGIKTFMMNHEQVVYEADLGPDTEDRAVSIERFNPDKRWSKADAK